LDTATGKSLNTHQMLEAANEQLRVLSSRLIRTQEAERRRIAGELHDNVGQSLTLLLMRLKHLKSIATESKVLAAAEDAIEAANYAIEQVRSLSVDLRPSVLDDLGLGAALRWYVDRQARSAGLRTVVRVSGEGHEIDSDAEVACFRAAQEAVANIIRHARARTISVLMRPIGEEVEVWIEDDGGGFDVQDAVTRASEGESFGLVGMQERVRLAGGTMAIDSQPGEGTTVRFTFPRIREVD
jgi:signal transduction histidine kinase